MSRFWIGVLTAAVALAQAGFSASAPITFHVAGLRSGEGAVRVDICTPETFLKSACPYTGSAPAAEGVTTVVLADVPPGTYAAQIFHDRNGNREVDQGFLGIPKEGIGFSNNASLGLHGPSFSSAAFVHGRAPQTLDVVLRHFGAHRSPPPADKR